MRPSRPSSRPQPESPTPPKGSRGSDFTIALTKAAHALLGVAYGKRKVNKTVDKQLHAQGFHTFILDGDNVRHGLNRDLGFTDADRVENIRRVAEVARLMADAGLIVLVSFISPFRAERAMARARSAEGEFVEVYVDTPLAECERRDPKGLYAKARAGQIANFTGLDSPYEPPEAPELVVRTAEEPLDASVERLFLAATGG